MHDHKLDSMCTVNDVCVFYRGLNLSLSLFKSADPKKEFKEVNKSTVHCHGGLTHMNTHTDNKHTHA